MNTEHFHTLFCRSSALKRLLDFHVFTTFPKSLMIAYHAKLLCFFFENSNLPRGKPTFEYPYGKSLTKTNWYHYNTRELEMSLLVVSFVRDLFEK